MKQQVLLLDCGWALGITYDNDTVAVKPVKLEHYESLEDAVHVALAESAYVYRHVKETEAQYDGDDGTVGTGVDENEDELPPF